MWVLMQALSWLMQKFWALPLQDEAAVVSLDGLEGCVSG